MSGFYGGRDGRSFLIAKNFESVAAMARAFDNPAYTEVNFDEYVLINTLNKNNPENGQIYRRGYDYTSNRKILSYTLQKTETEEGKVEITYTSEEIDANGAVYIGTIVGPAGAAPTLKFGYYDDIRLIDIMANYNNIDFPTIEKLTEYFNSIYPLGSAKYDVNEDLLVSNPNSYAGTTNFIKTNTIDGEVLHFHYDSMYVDRTDSLGWYLVNVNAIRVGEGSYSLGRDLVPGVEYELDENGNYIYEEVDGVKCLKIKPNSYQKTIDWKYCSVRNENNEDTTAYIGFKMASPVVEFEATPTDAYEKVDLIDKLSVDMNKDSIADHPFYSRWRLKIPKGIKGDSFDNLQVTKLNTDDTYYDINDKKLEDYSTKYDYITYKKYNYDNDAKGTFKTYVLGKYDQIQSLDFNEDGTLTIERTHAETLTKILHWITGASLEDNGTFILNFNDSKWNSGDIVNGVMKKEKLIKWINNILLKNDGTLEVAFNNGDTTSLEKALTRITGVTYENGILTITFNNESINTFTAEINGIKNVEIGEDQKLKITYSNNKSESIGEPINYIEQIKRDEDAASDTYNHLLIKHSANFEDNDGWQDLGGLNYTMVADDMETSEESTEEEKAQMTILNKKKADLAIGGIWFVSKNIPENMIPEEEPLPEEEA